MAKIRVGVLRGGPSVEHKISLKTGESVLKNLPPQYSGHDIVLTQKGEWYFMGWPTFPEKIFRSVDVVFNALHGHYGEDGKVQHLFETFNVPYTGSGVFASALGMNKILSREAFSRNGLRVPMTEIVDIGETPLEAAQRIFRRISPSWIIKPSSSGSSLGISIAHNFNDFVEAIKNTLAFGDKILVEEYIKGKEATCGVVQNFRDHDLYALPVIEIIPQNGSEFFDFHAKYSGHTQEICPANFNLHIKKDIEEMAKKAHNALGCRHYSRADFIISPRGIYVLEVNTLPGLTTESLLPKAINAVGSSYGEFLDHLITLALSHK